MADKIPGIDFTSEKTFSGLSYRKPVPHKERKLKIENEDLKSENIRDALTGLYNRRYFDQQMETIEKTDAEVGLAIIDVDFFKDVNDNFGHQAGDAVLRGMARK